MSTIILSVPTSNHSLVQFLYLASTVNKVYSETRAGYFV